MTTPTEAYRAATAILVRLAGETEEIRMLWLEGPDRAALCLPPERLEAHLATDDPRFAGLFAGHARILEALGAAAHEDSDAPCAGKLCRASLAGGHPFELVFERLSLLAKRPRAAVKPLVDKTGHLRHVLDYGRAPLSDRLA